MFLIGMVKCLKWKSRIQKDNLLWGLHILLAGRVVGGGEAVLLLLLITSKYYSLQ